MKRIILVFAVSLAIFQNTTFAGCANCGAEFNQAERAKMQELNRLERVDPPVRPDPIGNALIGGGVTSAMKGVGAGAVSAIRGAAIGTAVQGTKEKEGNK